MSVININNERKIDCDEGKSVFQALNRAGIHLPSACGGHGICGLCRVHADQPDTHTEAELAHISEEDRRAGVHLACRLTPKTDLNIQLSEDQLKAKPIRATVTDIRELTPVIKEITLKAETPMGDYKAGQFMLFRIPAYGASIPVTRTYSLACAPGGDRLQFEVQHVPGGHGSGYIHDKLTTGESVSLIGPYGNFYLRDDATNVIMIAGGSGMAPMKAIIEDVDKRGLKRHIKYYFGAKTQNDLFLLEEMRALEKKLFSFSFIPVLSNPLEGWTGRTGLAPVVAAEEMGERSSAYLCGGPGMINASIKLFTERGLPKERIFYDKFN